MFTINQVVEVANDQLVEVPYYEEKLKKVLSEMNIHSTTSATEDGLYALVLFCLEKNRVEQALLSLQENGIGNTVNTSISVMPASMHFEIPLHIHKSSRFVIFLSYMY